MTQKSPYDPTFLAGLAILFALTLHAGVIFLAHGHKLAPSILGGKAYMENQQVRGSDDETALLRQEETKRKNDQLAVIFKEMQARPEAEMSPLAQPSAQPSASIEPYEIKLESTAQLPNTVPDILYASNNFWINELIQATEMAQGQLESVEEQWESAPHTIKAGKKEGTLEGTAALNRSGKLDQGRTDTLLGSQPAWVQMDTESLIKGYYPSGASGSVFRNPNEGKANFQFGLDNPGSIASSDDFTLDVRVAPRAHDQGYLFRIELVPKPQVKFRRINQNYFFLVDRSRSIRFSRYEFTQQAVNQALDMLNPGDTFNILVFDDHVVAFAPQNLPWTPANVASAREFLSKQKYGGLFSTTELYSSLGKIVPAAVADNEVNTAILLSDGDTFLSSEKQRESIGKWTRQNSGKVSLYSLASGQRNNLPLLDVLSFFNKGMSLYSPLDRDISSTLFQLMQSLRNPIGKEMTVTAVRPSADVEIALFPPNSCLPNLYENSPFVVYGTINRLHDFHLFFQGKYYEKSFDIKHQVSFAESRAGDAAFLEKRLALFQAYDSYAHFLIDGKKSHLDRARQLLQPHNISMAFK